MAQRQPPADAAETPALETDSLTKTFGNLVAVDDVSLSVAPGEFRSIIGPNGAGKTTLFNLITGAMRPTAGSISLLGTDITALTPYERVHSGLARSFQITNVFNGLTVRENLRLAVQSVNYDDLTPSETLFARPESLADVNERTEAILDRVDLRQDADRKASVLPYGDRRRLEIGLVLATDPEVVLLDEPTAGMSSEETTATIDLIEDVLEDQTLLLVEHDVELVMSISDTISVLHKGALLAEGTPDEIAGNEDVQEAYLGGFD
jgi:branched-chain amino acid transport system ATP-binding protein